MQEEDSPSTRLEDSLKRTRAVRLALSVAPCAVSAATASTLRDVQILRCARTRERRQSVQQMRVDAEPRAYGCWPCMTAGRPRSIDGRRATRWAENLQ
jgi:hypothetical protein